jgi:sirohydrochlorin ferrochelatase
MLLHGQPPPHGVLADLRDRPVHVMPVLMCAGRNTLQKLPRVLGLLGEIEGAAPTLHICRPLGLHPALVRLVAARACEAMDRNHWAPGGASVLLVAHGSRTGAASRRAAELQAARLRALGLFRAVSTAFLEEKPFLPEALASMAGPLVMVGLFAAAGVHADQDVTRMIADARRTDVDYLGAIGADADIPDVIVEIVDAMSQLPFRRKAK